MLPSPLPLHYNLVTPMDFEPETTLANRYRLRGRLGSGGMADVFRATDLNLQRQVAIKILREELISDPTFQASFLQEARAAANLSHPNIVTIHDFGHEGRRYFIVMEYVHGTDLKTMIRRQGPLPVDHALDLVTQACAGVGYAHRAGLIHCDLKPHNILVSPDGGAKITDFGIARALASIHPQEHQEVVWGSPQYFAPEQAAGHAPSPASDVYSLGVVLFETLTGRLPFEAANPDDLAEQHQYEPPPSPRAFNPDIPPALEMILLKVLSKEPSARYRTADQFGRVLRSFNPAQASRVPASAPIDGPRPPAQADLPTMAQVPVLGDVDWLAVLLGLIAFLALGGLIPLWLWACLQYPSCPLPAW